MKTIRATVELETSSGIVRKAITDHAALPHHVSMLREVKVLEAKEGGVGTVRQCTLISGKSFQEKITAWDEGRATVTSPTRTKLHFPSLGQKRAGVSSTKETALG